MTKYRENEPTADVLMISMRAMGYSFESAVADIVDNSVAAGAKRIHIKFPIDPLDLYVAVCDDGCGMTSEELFNAMRYGSRRSDEERGPFDLGRFGLGMKSASLSQCRKLTVISKKSGKVSAFSWDLDIVEEKKEWLVAEYDAAQIEELRFVEWLEDKDSGTVVVWENFDIIEKSGGGVYSELTKYKDSVSNYLELIFHRFLNKTGDNQLEIMVNNYKLKGLDPFLENHNKTNIRRKVEIPIPDSKGVERYVVVQPFVLPFQKDLTEADKKLSGGTENYRSKQGFYIYRNERLIVWGSWFGRHRDELTKYARVRVDIPNTLDDVWGIDIKKQSAKIPPSIKTRLNRAVDDVMDKSVQAQKYRGEESKINPEVNYIWKRIKGRGEAYSYHVNRDSRIFDLLKDRIDGDAWNILDMVLEEIEEAVPYQQIYIDKSQNKIDEEDTTEREADVYSKAKMMLKLANEMGGRSMADLIQDLFMSEPFVNYPSVKEKIVEENSGNKH